MSLAESNFASSARAADESSCPFRSRQTWYGFRRFLYLDPSIHYRQADREFPYRNPYLRFLPRQCYRSNQLQSHQLVRDSRPTQPVDASAKPYCFLWISPLMVHSYSISDAARLISDLNLIITNISRSNARRISANKFYLDVWFSLTGNELHQ